MDHALLQSLEAVWGRGFLSPGGTRDAIRELLGDVSTEHAEILDFGCGLGGYSRLFATELGAKGVVGVDADRELLARAERDAASCVPARPRFLPIVDGRVPLGDASVDLAFAKEVFLYVADRAPAFAEIFRMLRPGGSFVLIDLMRRDLEPSDRMREFMSMEDSFMPVSIDTLATYRQTLSEVGFVERACWDLSRAYLRHTLREAALLRAMNADEVEAMGAEMHRFMCDNWRSTIEVLESGELLIHTLALTRPETPCS